jgi:hypothetical protein
MGKMAHRIRKKRGCLFIMVFTVGVLLGWMVIGWWLWPVKWINTDPWDLRPEHQRTFIDLVAEDYWRTKDVSRAKRALAGWDEEALADLLATMQYRASSDKERQKLSALAEVIELPESEVLLSTERAPLLTSLLSRKAIVLSTAFSTSWLVMAIILAVSSPFLRAGTKVAQEGMTEAQQVKERGETWVEAKQAKERGEMWGDAKQAQAQETPEQEVGVKKVTLDETSYETPLPQGQEQQIRAQQPEIQEQELQLQQPVLRSQEQFQVQQPQVRFGLQQPGLQPQAQPQMQQPGPQPKAQFQVQQPGLQPQAQQPQMQQPGPQPKAQFQVQQPGLQPQAQQPQMQQPALQLPEQFQLEDVQEKQVYEDAIWKVFESEGAIDIYLQALAESLEDVDILDLSERCKEVILQLRRGHSLSSGRR